MENNSWNEATEAKFKINLFPGIWLEGLRKVMKSSSQ
jgi:hypothetical protein